MKRLVACLLSALTLVLGWNAIMATPDPPKKKLGPEWTKDKDDEQLYRRKMEIEVIRRTTLESTGYTIPLVNHTVNIWETDDNRGAEVFMIPRVGNIPHGELDVRKDVKGKVSEMTVKLRDIIYYDLDGDGMIDAYFDNRRGKSIAKIVFEGRFVEVEDQKSIFGHAPNEKPEVGRTVRYIFEDGTWKIKK